MIDYTIYSPAYVPNEGECWDFPTLRSAKLKAESFGPGSIIVRNFNINLQKNGIHDNWFQAKRCWEWDGVVFKKVCSITPGRWLVAGRAWPQAASLNRIRSRSR